MPGLSHPRRGPNGQASAAERQLLFRIDPAQLTDQKERDPARQPAQLATIETGWVWLAQSRDGQDVAAIGGDRAAIEVAWQEPDSRPLCRVAAGPGRPMTARTSYGSGKGRRSGTRLGDEHSGDCTDAERSKPVALDVGWLLGRTIVALRLADDGQRIALISTDAHGANPHVDVAGVVRARNGLPERLAEPLRVASTLTLARDLVWVDQTSVAVLGRIAPGLPMRVWIAEVGGRTLAAAVSDVPGAQSLTTVNGERGLVVTTDMGVVLLGAGSSWADVADGTDFAVPAT